MLWRPLVLPGPLVYQPVLPLGYEHLGRPQSFMGVENSRQPDFSVLSQLDSESEFDDAEVNDFTGLSPYNISVQAETLLRRYLGDHYSGDNTQSSQGADTETGGRPSARSGLFQDASLANDSGLVLPTVLASEIEFLDSVPDLRAQPSGGDSTFRFRDQDHTRFFDAHKLAPDTQAFGHSLRAPSPSPLKSKEYRSRDAA